MLAYFIVVFGALIRVLSHESNFAFLPPNFSPIAAMALFVGVHLSGRQAYGVPIIALLVSDAIIGFYDSFVMASVYGSFLLTVVIGRWFGRHRTLFNGAASVVVASTLFYLITNFAVWAAPASFYPHTFEGLMASYVAGLPFFRYTLAGDAFFTAMLFLTFEVARSLVSRRAALVEHS